MTSNITRCLCYCSKTREYQYFDVCWPETSSCASKPLLLRCNLVIPQCICQVSLRLKEVQMGTHDFKYNKVPLFARKPWNINTSMSAATILALVPASRYYCDVTWSYHNACSKFHKDCKRFRRGPMTLDITRFLFLLEKQKISILRCLLPRNKLLCQQAVITAM